MYATLEDETGQLADAVNGGIDFGLTTQGSGMRNLATCGCRLFISAGQTRGRDSRQRPVECHNSATGPDLGFYAARSYSLRRPGLVCCQAPEWAACPSSGTRYWTSGLPQPVAGSRDAADEDPCGPDHRVCRLQLPGDHFISVRLIYDPTRGGACLGTSVSAAVKRRERSCLHLPLVTPVSGSVPRRTTLSLQHPPSCARPLPARSARARSPHHQPHTFFYLSELPQLYGLSGNYFSLVPGLSRFFRHCSD